MQRLIIDEIQYNLTLFIFILIVPLKKFPYLFTFPQLILSLISKYAE